MIEIQSIASSSAGNCYWISDGITPLLIEAGISINKIKRALNFQLSGISGCLITHGHGDHSMATKDLLRAGIDCFCTLGTQEEIGFDVMDDNRMKTIKANCQFSIGTWTIMPFKAIHDSKEPVSFLLQSEKNKVVFATDTAFIPYRFNGLTHIMVECNYDKETMERNVRNGHLNFAQYARVAASHFGLHNVVDFLKANDLRSVKEIYLMHLSGGNADEELIKQTIKRTTGIPVYICQE